MWRNGGREGYIVREREGERWREWRERVREGVREKGRMREREVEKGGPRERKRGGRGRAEGRR